MLLAAHYFASSLPFPLMPDTRPLARPLIYYGASQFQSASCFGTKMFAIFLLTCCLFFSPASVRSFDTEGLNTDLKFIYTCNMTSPISMQTMNEVLINKKLAQGESSAFKCFLHCLFTKYGWMDGEGGFLLHDIKQTLEEADIEVSALEYILYKCTATKSVDKCERSFVFTQCFWDKMAEQQPSEDQLFYNIENKKK